MVKILDTFSVGVTPPEGEGLLVLKAEDEFLMEKINWEKMLSIQILPNDSYDKKFHIKDVFFVCFWHQTLTL